MTNASGEIQYQNAHSSRPNVVLIMVDQWRGDCLSIDQHPVVHTPFLDGLALQGAHFRRTYTAVPSCIASRAALLTGLSQRSHKRVGYEEGVPWDYPTSLAHEFTRHGYQTQAVGKMHVYPARYQMGFQNVILHDGYVAYLREQYDNQDLVDDYLPWLRQQLGRDDDDFYHGVHCNSIVARPWDKPEHTHPTNYVATQSIDFLRRRDPTKPFFLFMSFHRPHPPYDPPQWAFDQYVHREMPPPPVGDWTDAFADMTSPHDPVTFVGPIAPELLTRARAGYYGLMTHIDHQINRFIESLRHSRLLDNTYLCFISDHGELIGDHHLFRKYQPYEGSSRVPFILKGPPGSPIKPNSTFDTLVELRDVMPTLLDCAGLPIPDSVEGRSLLPVISGQSGDWREYLHGEYTLYGRSLQWIITQQYKYIWFSDTGREQLFDLQQDPNEEHNLALKQEYGELIQQLRETLIQELSGREEGYTDGKNLFAGRSPVETLTR